MSRNQTPGRIPVLLSDGTTAFGGARVCFRDLLENLDKEKFSIIALMRDRRAEFGAIPGVRFCHYPYLLQYEVGLQLRKRRWLPGKLASALSFPVHAVFHFLPYSLFLAGLCLRHRIRVIHLNNQLLSNLPALWIARTLGIRTASHQREFPLPSKVFKNRLCDALIHRHVAVSECIRQALIEAGIPAAKVEVIYDSVDFHKLSEAKRDKDKDTSAGARISSGQEICKLGMFGRVVGWKGQLQVIQAVEMAALRNPGLKLYIVGNASDADDGYLEACRDYCRTRGLEGRVEFTGYIPRPHLLMAEMDVIVHNSVSPEPFGMVVAEGMALGKLVLASRLGGPAEIIQDGINGYLVNPLDVAAIAEKLLFLASGPRGLLAVRQAAEATVREKFNLETQVGKVGRLYQALLAGPRRPATSS